MIVLGLGTNLGDRQRNLEAAVIALTEGDQPILRQVTISSVYESAALLPEDAPKEWDIPYYNMVLTGKTLQTPEMLLATLKGIEKELGRTKTGHWGPRVIDIDLLSFDDVTREGEHLALPHPRMLERDFVLVPLAEIAPNWWHSALPEADGTTNVASWTKKQGMSAGVGLEKTELRLDVSTVKRAG